jgi:hypothetical protein
MRLAGTLHNPLSVKHFHAVWAGNVPECSLKSCIGKASVFPVLIGMSVAHVGGHL